MPFSGTAQSSIILFSQKTPVTIANTTQETSAIGLGIGSLLLPAGFWVPGRTVRVSGYGVYTISAISANAAIKTKIGSTVLNTTTTTSALLTSGSNNAFSLDHIIQCTSSGATGQLMVSGNINYKATGGRVFDDLTNSGTAVTVDTTQSGLLDMTITWDGNTGRSLTNSISLVEKLN